MTVPPGVQADPGAVLLGQAQLLERIARGSPLPDVLAAIVRFVEHHASGAAATIHVYDLHQPDGDPPPHSWAVTIPGPQGGTVGTIALRYSPPREPTPPERDVLAVASHLASIAIERHSVADRLRLSDERLRLLGKATDDIVWDWDLTTGTLWWGEGAAALAGLPPNTLLPDTSSWSSRLHPDDRDRVLAGLHVVIDGGGRSWSDEYRFRRTDGSYAAILDRGYVIRDARGRPLRMVGSMMDVTERTRAHAALAARERQFREAQRVARLGSWEWDPATDTVTWSEEMYRMYGVSPQRFTPTSPAILALIAPGDRAAVQQSTERCLAEQRPFAYDLRINRADGSVRILHCRGHAVADPAGRVSRLLGTAQDVTERRHIEERLRDSQRRLRALTARREAILEEERARIAREIHDELGQILTASKLDVAWVRESLPDAPAEIRGRLVELAERLDATVKTVRRITTELRPVVLDQLGLGPAVEWLGRDFTHRTGLACSVRAELDGHVLPPETATGLFRILQEALTNVARHAGAQTVRVELWAVDQTVCLEVTDDGLGFEADAGPGEGLGIMGMRERAILLGGALELGPAQPSGTRLSVWAPIP